MYIRTCEHLFFAYFPSNHRFSKKSMLVHQRIILFCVVALIAGLSNNNEMRGTKKKIKKAIIQEAKQKTVNVCHTINFGRLLFCHKTKTGSLDQQWQCKYCFNL